MLTQLQCPSCGSNSLDHNEKAHVVICQSCRNKFSTVDGVICFVPGHLFTKLDSIDYDKHYSISNESSRQAFVGLKNVMGDRLRNDYDVLLEIGAGTGGFTKGLLTSVRVGSAIVTDISSKMLAVCRKRVLDDEHLADNVIFTTYSTAEDIFPSGSVDCVIGSFVLHHILDYKGFLRTSYDILRKEGTFIFAEPSYKFHYALVQSMAEVLETLVNEGDLNAEHDLIRLGNWIHELHFNLKYVGDREVLSDREDKHLFLREDVEQAAFDAGFDLVETISYGDPEHVDDCLLSYLPQLDLSPEFLERATGLFGLYQAKYFDLLEDADAVPAYVFYFRKHANLTSRVFKHA